MDTNRIAALLKPFLTGIPDLNKNCRSGDSCHSEQSVESEFAIHATLSQPQLENISTYIDLLIRWNARINLTAIRHPEGIVTRHFGESFFAARHLLPKKIELEKPTRGKPAKPALSEAEGGVQGEQSSAQSVIDLGSGAGFPGLPIKIWAPGINLTLIESNQKKATFLREVTRTLTLMNVNVFSGRAEQYGSSSVDAVTLRAVERFESILPLAAKLVAPNGQLALLISEAQLAIAHDLTPTFRWASPIPIPLSSSRILAVGIRKL